jgi:dienelactone hydrolase
MKLLTYIKQYLVFLIAVSVLIPTAMAGEKNMSLNPSEYQKWANVHLDSLSDMSVESLRNRVYGSTVKILRTWGIEGGNNGYQAFYSKDGTKSYDTYVAEYDSDGLRVYTRVDIPAGDAPADGYPVVVFLHGWVGIKNAPNYTLNYYENSYYGDIIDSYVDAGFMVVMPAFRGHSTVDGIPGAGIDFMEKFDNGSYLSPLFYAIDALNLIEGLDSIKDNDWSKLSTKVNNDIKINPNAIFISGHSQGGDAVLTALAVSGEGSGLKNKIKAGSIWSGCFPSRITQVETYGPMGESAEAFKAGSQADFEWNGTAKGSDGSINPNFIFSWAPDWIGSINPVDWSWQTKYFGKSVEAMLKKKYGQMYDTYNNQVKDISNSVPKFHVSANNKVSVTNDPEIIKATNALSAFNYPDYLKDEPIVLHHSDQDYYSMSSWNADLSGRINKEKGKSYDFEYPKNNHSMKKSKHKWYDTDNSAVPGRQIAIQRDIALFKGKDPSEIKYP